MPLNLVDTIFEDGPLVDHYHLLHCILVLLLVPGIFCRIPRRLILDNVTYPLLLVENTGIEPVVPEGGGFTVHCITIDASSPLVLLSHYLLDLNTLYSSLRFIDLVTQACDPWLTTTKLMVLRMGNDPI